MRIHQWVPAAHRGDAIGDSARTVRELLRGMGHDSEIFALTIDDDLRGDVLPFQDAAATQGDVTIFHFALPSPMTEAFASLKGVKILQYHNITPAAFFAPYDPGTLPARGARPAGAGDTGGAHRPGPRRLRVQPSGARVARIRADRRHADRRQHRRASRTRRRGPRWSAS